MRGAEACAPSKHDEKASIIALEALIASASLPGFANVAQRLVQCCSADFVNSLALPVPNKWQKLNPPLLRLVFSFTRMTEQIRAQTPMQRRANATSTRFDRTFSALAQCSFARLRPTDSVSECLAICPRACLCRLLDRERRRCVA